MFVPLTVIDNTTSATPRQSYSAWSVDYDNTDRHGDAYTHKKNGAAETIIGVSKELVSHSTVLLARKYAEVLAARNQPASTGGCRNFWNS